MMYQPKTKAELQELVKDVSINLGDIDTSLITDMSGLFKESKRRDFSGIESWDVSKVTNMSEMFREAVFFNQPLDSWDVSNVEDMWLMFSDAIDFNQSLESWNVSKVKVMCGMFGGSGQKILPRWYS